MKLEDVALPLIVGVVIGQLIWQVIKMLFNG